MSDQQITTLGIQLGWAGRDAFAGFGAEAAEIAVLFRIKVAWLRHRLRPHEIPAAVRLPLEEKQGALRALRDRRAALRHWQKMARLVVRAPI